MSARNPAVCGGLQGHGRASLPEQHGARADGIVTVILSPHHGLTWLRNLGDLGAAVSLLGGLNGDGPAPPGRDRPLTVLRRSSSVGVRGESGAPPEPLLAWLGLEGSRHGEFLD